MHRTRTITFAQRILCGGMVLWGCDVMAQSNPSSQLSEGVYQGVLRERIHSSAESSQGRMVMTKELVFSSQKDTYSFCHQKPSRSLQKFSLFTLKIRGKIQPWEGSLMGSCLYVEDIEFLATPQGQALISGTLHKAQQDGQSGSSESKKSKKDSSGYVLMPAGGDGGYRFAKLPKLLEASVRTGQQVMVVVRADIQTQKHYKLVNYYPYPKLYQPSAASKTQKKVQRAREKASQQD